MRVEFNALPDGLSKFDGTFDTKPSSFGEQFLNSDTIYFEATIERKKEKIVIVGWAKTQLDCQCDSCLERFVSQFEGQFQETILFENDSTASIDIEHLAYESIILNIPVRILCKSECRGLCSGCGVNLNFEKCQCEIETDPRWEVLKTLVTTEEEEE